MKNKYENVVKITCIWRGLTNIEQMNQYNKFIDDNNLHNVEVTIYEDYELKTAITMAIAKMKECNLDNDKLLLLYGGVYFFINKLTSAESCAERYLNIRTNKGFYHE